MVEQASGIVVPLAARLVLLKVADNLLEVVGDRQDIARGDADAVIQVEIKARGAQTAEIFFQCRDVIELVRGSSSTDAVTIGRSGAGVARVEHVLRGNRVDLVLDRIVPIFDRGGEARHPAWRNNRANSVGATGFRLKVSIATGDGRNLALVADLERGRIDAFHHAARDDIAGACAVMRGVGLAARIGGGGVTQGLAAIEFGDAWLTIGCAQRGAKADITDRRPVDAELPVLGIAERVVMRPATLAVDRQILGEEYIVQKRDFGFTVYFGRVEAAARVALRVAGGVARLGQRIGHVVHLFATVFDAERQADRATALIGKIDHLIVVHAQVEIAQHILRVIVLGEFGVLRRLRGHGFERILQDAAGGRVTDAGIVSDCAGRIGRVKLLNAVFIQNMAIIPHVFRVVTGLGDAVAHGSVVIPVAGDDAVHTAGDLEVIGGVFHAAATEVGIALLNGDRFAAPGVIGRVGGNFERVR